MRMRNIDPMILKAIYEAEKHMGEEATGQALEAAGLQWKGMVQKSGELYEILCSLTDGDAKVIVQNSSVQDGLGVWQALKRAYGRKTLAATLKRHRYATVTKQAKDVMEVKGMIAK